MVFARRWRGYVPSPGIRRPRRPGRFLGRFQELQLPGVAAPPLVEDFRIAPATAFVDAQVLVPLAVLRQGRAGGGGSTASEVRAARWATPSMARRPPHEDGSSPCSSSTWGMLSTSCAVLERTAAMPARVIVPPSPLSKGRSSQVPRSRASTYATFRRVACSARRRDPSGETVHVCTHTVAAQTVAGLVHHVGDRLLVRERGQYDVGALAGRGRRVAHRGAGVGQRLGGGAVSVPGAQPHFRRRDVACHGLPRGPCAEHGDHGPTLPGRRGPFVPLIVAPPRDARRDARMPAVSTAVRCQGVQASWVIQTVLAFMNSRRARSGSSRP